MYLEAGYQIPITNSQNFFTGSYVFEDNSICLITSTIASTLVQHYNSHGLIKQYYYNAPTYQGRAKPINSFEIIMLHPTSQTIQKLHLLTGKKQSFKIHLKEKDKMFTSFLTVFPQTKTFCVFEKYTQNAEPKTHFTFFDKNVSQLYQYTCQQNSQMLKLLSINLKSKIAILKGKQTDMIKINILDFLNQSYTPYQIALPIHGDYIIKDIKQFKENKLLLFCESNSPGNQLLQWDLVEGQISRFQFPQVDSKLISDIHFGGDYFYLFLLDPTSLDKVPLYIVDAYTLETVHKNVGAKNYEHEYWLSINYGHSRLIQFKFERNRLNSMGIRILNVLSISQQKQLYLDMLQKVDNFSEEMLRYIVNAIKYQ